MIKNFLIINCIGKDDKLGLRINKDFFVHDIRKKNNYNQMLVSEIMNFVNSHEVKLDKNFSVIVNQGPGSFSRVRVSLAVAKGLEISKNVRLFGYKDTDLAKFNQENIEKLFNRNLVEKKLQKNWDIIL